MQLVYLLHLLGYLLGVFEGFFNAPDVDWDAGLLFEVLPQLQVEDVGVSLVDARFVDHGQTQVFFDAIRTLWLQEVFDRSHCWNLIRNERPQFGLQVHHLWFEHSYLLEEFFDVVAHFKLFLIFGILLAGHEPLFAFEAFLEAVTLALEGGVLEA